MTNLITTLTAALSNAVLIAAAVVMAGLGFAVLGTLALFAVLGLGVAMIAAPFAATRLDDTATADASA